MKQFTAIKGRFSEARELPRIGKIRLGLKVQGGKGSYPTETDYFVCPDEVKEAYGDTPIELDVLLPSNKRDEVFRSKYAMYGSGSGLKCHGDGVEAERFDEKTNEWKPRTCPCEHLKSDDNPKGTCTAKSDLMVMLPLVSMGGCYQIKTGSAAATKNINSSLDLIQFLTGGRIAFLPMKLRRVPIEMTHEGHKRTHYIMTLTLNATWQQALQLRQHPDSMVIPAEYQIAAPLDENPELDPDDVVVDAEVLAGSDDAQLAEIQRKLNEQQGKKATPKPAETKPKETPPQQTPGPRASTLPDQATAGGTTVKSEAPQISLELPAPTRLGTGTIPTTQWVEVMGFIDADPDLNTLRSDWKAEHKVDHVVRLTPQGQQVFLTFMREQAPKTFPY